MKNPLPSTAFKNIGTLRGLLLLAVLLLLISPAYATIRYVDASVLSGGAGDGSSWANAYATLQPAIDASTAGDEVWVAQGIYKPTTSTTDRTVSFVMKEGVKIYGGFTSGQPNLTDRSTNPATNGTVLSGDIDSDNTWAGNSYHVIFNNGLTAAAVLDGFTITGGNADGSSPNNDGGGIYNESSGPSLTNCSFFLNNSVASGGGLCNASGSSPLLTNCSFLRNSASNGGAIYNSGGPFLTNCSFQDNTADYGGGVYNESSYDKLINCSFLNNSASVNGGGMYNAGSAPALINCSLLSNSASSSGGGMYGKDSRSVLINCSFLSNAASLGEGIYNEPNCDTALRNCVLFGNGGANAIVNNNTARHFLSAKHSLFEASVQGYIDLGNNITTAISPFVSLSNAIIRPSSPAIDAGDDAIYTTFIGPATDLAGNPRRVGTIDMGAYEFQAGQRTWIGSVSSSWNEPGNWSPASVPTAWDAVFINPSPHDPLIGSSLSVHTGIITLNVGVILTVDNGGTLNVHGSGGALGNINTNGGTLTPGGIINYL